MTLWSYGASYSQCPQYMFASPCFESQYIIQVANTLGCDVQSLGLDATSLDYSYQEFYNTRHSIKDEDIVIVTLTDSVRRWFFKDHPKWAIFREIHDDVPNKTELNLALKYYTLYLDDNKQVYITALYNFLCALELASIRKRLQTVVMFNYGIEYELATTWGQDFKHIHIAKGTLFDVTMNELEDNEKLKWDIMYRDPRLNHLTKSNHVVLSDKILAWIRGGIEIDLTRDFMQGTVTEAALRDPEFIAYELFSWGTKWTNPDPSKTKTLKNIFGTAR